MTRLLTYTGLALLGWLALCTAWAVTARVTGFPGPASAARATVDLAASGIEAGPLPAPLSSAQRAAARQLRATGRVVARFYRLPERLAARLLNRGYRHWHAGARSWDRDFEDQVAPADRRVRVEIEVGRDLERSVAPRIEAEVARIEAIAPRIEARIAGEIEARLERVRHLQERVRRVERSSPADLPSGWRQR